MTHWCKNAGCRPASQCEIEAAVAGSETHPKAPAPAEGAGQFHASWMRANIRRLVEKNPSEIEIEFAEAYAASLREQLAQAQRESAHFEELMHAAVEDYGNAERELEEARALIAEHLAHDGGEGCKDYDASIYCRTRTALLALARSTGTKERGESGEQS